MTQFTEEVLIIIKHIPYGKVMSYGQIAKFAGNSTGTRQVVRILHSMSNKYDLPWYRVINAKGKISIKDPDGASLQKELLIAEGVKFSEDGVVDPIMYYKYNNIQI